MTITIDSQRKTIALKFTGVTGDTFNLRATNADDQTAHSSGPHDLELNNNGEGTFVVTYPADFTGESFIEITGSDGSRAQGEITIT